MTQVERRAMIVLHADLIMRYINWPPGDLTLQSQRDASHRNIMASANRLHELAQGLTP